MIARIRKSLDEKEQGFTLVELLVVVVIVGILAAIAIPAFLRQREGALIAQVEGGLSNLAIAAETNYQKNYEYLATPEAFTESGQAGATSDVAAGLNWTAWVSTDLDNPGYVIAGRAASGDVLAISTWNGKNPVKFAKMASLPATPAALGTPVEGGAANAEAALRLPTGVTFGSAITINAP